MAKEKEQADALSLHLRFVILVGRNNVQNES
jgi:hypothetical protein